MVTDLKSLYGEYLEYSLRYYEFDESVVTDHEFDDICKTLAEGWDKFEHRYKHLTTLDDLRAGTGYTITVANAPKYLSDLILKYPNQKLKDVFDKVRKW